MAPPSETSSSRKTLARFLQERRDALFLSREAVAHTAGISLGLYQQLEEGLLNFLSVTNRARLAKALRCETYELKHFEIPPPDIDLTPVSLLSVDDNLIAYFSNGKRLPLLEMERNPEGFWPCPNCGADVQLSTFQREDLMHRSWLNYRVRCSHCLLQINHEALIE